MDEYQRLKGALEGIIEAFRTLQELDPIFKQADATEGITTRYGTPTPSFAELSDDDLGLLIALRVKVEEVISTSLPKLVERGWFSSTGICRVFTGEVCRRCERDGYIVGDALLDMFPFPPTLLDEWERRYADGLPPKEYSEVPLGCLQYKHKYPDGQMHDIHRKVEESSLYQRDKEAGVWWSITPVAKRREMAAELGIDWSNFEWDLIPAVVREKVVCNLKDVDRRVSEAVHTRREGYDDHQATDEDISGGRK